MCSRDLFHDMFTCAKYFMAIYEHSRAAKYIYLSLRLQTVEDAAAREVVLGSNTGQIQSRDSAGLPVRERTLQRVPEEGILKRSSAFLASLSHHPSSKLAERNSPDDELTKFLRSSDSYELRGSLSSRYTDLKGYFSVLTNDDDAELCALRPSSSVQTLSTSFKKKGVGVKKSVSFSSDTSFEEKRAPYRKSAVHEAKVYRKGVLQGEFCVSYDICSITISQILLQYHITQFLLIVSKILF